MRIPERRACRALGQHRSTQRKIPRGRDDAGRSSVPAIMELMARSSLLTKVAVLPEGTQPDTVDVSDLRELLGLR